MKRHMVSIVGVMAAAFGLLWGSVALRGAGGEDAFRQRRLRMVSTQVEARGITDAAVVAAMQAVPRHRFVTGPLQPLAYDDSPLPIGHGQTISQPEVVAMMTSLIRPTPSMRVLEVGTGSGYQAAVLACCVKQVDTIEIVPELGRQAERLLSELGYKNVRVRVGDGYAGWPEHAPYDAIVLTAAPERVPQPLLDQLRTGGRLVAPVGRGVQDLQVLTKTSKGITIHTVADVRFVPMTGKAAQDR